MSSVAVAEGLIGLRPQANAAEKLASLPIRGVEAIRWYAHFFVDPIGSMIKAQSRYGDLVSAGRISRVFGRERQHFLAFGPGYNRQVLGDPEVFHTTAQAWKGSRGSSLRRIRNGLTRMNGEKYRQQRQLLLPTFSKKAVEGYVADMAEIMRHVLEEQWHVGQTVDMYRLMRSTALRVSTQILFGRPTPAEADGLAQLGQNFMPRTFSPAVWMFPFDMPFTPFRGMRRNAEQIENALLAMIEKRRAAPSERVDLLSTLVAAFDQQSVPMDNSDLIGQAAILFVASYENVAAVLTWTAFLLAQHPEIMDDLHAELRAVLDGQPPSAEQLDRLPLLDAVIKESMRVLPPVPFLVRKAAQPTMLGGARVNVGDRVACSPYITHHQADIYPQPKRFRPDRWFGLKPDPYEYLPFGCGPRACIGKMFAMRELKVALAMILGRHRLAVEPNTHIDRRVQVMMSPKHGLPMTIHAQDGRFRAAPVSGNIHEMVELPQSSL